MPMRNWAAVVSYSNSIVCSAAGVTFSRDCRNPSSGASIMMSSGGRRIGEVLPVTVSVAKV